MVSFLVGGFIPAVPLNDMSFAVLEKVVELFYYGEIRVMTSIKGKLFKALNFLKVDGLNVPAPLSSILPVPHSFDESINLIAQNGVIPNGKESSSSDCSCHIHSNSVSIFVSNQ